MARGNQDSGADSDIPLDQRSGPRELPRDASERLGELRGEGGKKRLFTSDLSVSELAMERMQAEAENLGADGITGTQIKESSHGWDSHVIEFFAVGTAVISIRDDHEITTPQMVLSLNS